MTQARSFSFARPVSFGAGQRTFIEHNGVSYDATIVSIARGTGRAKVKAGRNRTATLNSVPTTEVVAIIHKSRII